MKTIGETLKRVREKQQLTIEAIAAKTKIKPEFLREIEANEFYGLPSSAAAQGFIATYAEVLGIEKRTALALLRRDFEVTAKQVIPKEMLAKTPRRRSLPQGLKVAAFVVVGVLVIGGYGVWSFWRLHQPPDLQITFPKDQDLVSTDVTVRGKTASDAVVEIDTIPVALNQDGEFVQQLSLSSGDHSITVVARNRDRQETVKQLTVHVK